jgi:hypothetical protein
MKGIINAPHSILHGRDCEVIETKKVEKVRNVQVDSYPNVLPFHFKEIKITEGVCVCCKKYIKGEGNITFIGEYLYCVPCSLPF